MNKPRFDKNKTSHMHCSHCGKARYGMLLRAARSVWEKYPAIFECLVCGGKSLFQPQKKNRWKDGAQVFTFRAIAFTNDLKRRLRGGSPLSA